MTESKQGTRHRKDTCVGSPHGSRCRKTTRQFAVFMHGGKEHRWPVCDEHATNANLRHLGTRVWFEPKDAA